MSPTRFVAPSAQSWFIQQRSQLCYMQGLQMLIKILKVNEMLKRARSVSSWKPLVNYGELELLTAVQRKYFFI